jgi:hypothetical protein
MTAAELLEAALLCERQALPASPDQGGLLRLQGLLSRVRVVEDRGVPTLAISQVPRGYLLRVNPDFCERQVRCALDARLVIAHEVLHASKGHFRLRLEPHAGMRSLLNLSLDMLVNSYALALAVPGGEAPILGRLHSPTSFPEVLLVPLRLILAASAGADKVPPSALEPMPAFRAAVRADPSLRPAVRDAVARHLVQLGVVHADAFARACLRAGLDWPCAEDYWAVMRALFIAEFGDDPRARGVFLLGSHDTSDELAETRPVEVPEIAAGLDQAIRAVSAEGRTTPTASPEAVRRFCREVVAVLDNNSRSGPEPVRRVEAVTTPIPMPGRRDLAYLAAGIQPVLWHPRLSRTRAERRGVHVYLDVSGSTERSWPLFLGLTRALGRRLVLPAWAWSLGPPEPMTREDLQAGRFKTMGGTDFEPVVEHAIEQLGARRILVVTDGMFEVGPALPQRVKGAGLAITFALTLPLSFVEDDLAPIAERIFALPVP